MISALKLILGEDGTDRGAKKIAKLHANSNYMRQRLIEMGLAVLGDKDSPVMVSEKPPSLPPLPRGTCTRNTPYNLLLAIKHCLKHASMPCNSLPLCSL